MNYDSVIGSQSVIPEGLCLMVRINSKISTPPLPHFPCLLFFFTQVAASGAPVVSWIPRLPGVRHGQRSLSALRRSSGRDIPSQTASSLQYRSESAAPTSQTERIPSGQYQSDDKDVPVGHLVIFQKVDNSTNFSQTQVPPHTSGARHQLLNSILLLRKHDG